MTKTISRSLLAAGALAAICACGTVSAGAMGMNAALSRAAGNDAIVLAQTEEQKQAEEQKRAAIAQKKKAYMEQKKKAYMMKMMQKKKQQQQAARFRPPKINLSEEQKQQIRQNTPAEYQQYLPKSITGKSRTKRSKAGAEAGASGAPAASGQ